MIHCQNNIIFRQGDSVTIVFWNIPTDRSDYSLHFNLFDLATNTPITEVRIVPTESAAFVAVPLSAEFTRQIPVSRGERQIVYGIGLKLVYPINKDENSITTLIPSNITNEIVPTATVLSSFAQNSSSAGVAPSFVNLIQGMRNDLSAEILTRAQEITRLENQIGTSGSGLAEETTARIAGDEALQTAINDEINRATNAENSLQTKVDNLQMVNGAAVDGTINGNGLINSRLGVVNSLFVADYINGKAGVQVLSERKQVMFDTEVVAVLTSNVGLTGVATSALIIEFGDLSDPENPVYTPVLGIMDWNALWSNKLGVVDVVQTTVANELMKLSAVIPAGYFYTLININASNFASCVEYPLLINTLRAQAAQSGQSTIID